MKAVVNKSVLKGMVKAIASKSYAHRALIAAALADVDTKVICEDTSDDILATINCLKAMGAKIKDIENGYLITPIDKGNVENKLELDCNESGSTLRFLLPIVSSFKATTVINMKEGLVKRPIEPLRSELISHGAIISKQGVEPLEIKGAIKSGDYVVPGNISSQYISGLLFILPILEGDSTITITNTIESKSYIDMTIDILKQFEIEVDWNDDVINIKGGQEYKSPSEIYVEGDWSNMAFWLAAGSFNENEMSCGNLNFYSIQGDRYILEIIKKFGINIIYDSNNSLILTHCPMNGIEIDASNVPDLVPVIALLASVSEGTTIISNIGRLRIKESDRIESIATTLNKLGANVTATEDSLTIKGVKSLKGGEVDSCNDHRIVMMAAIAAMVCEEPVIITNANAVNKSYRTFFEDYKKIGGIVKYVD